MRSPSTRLAVDGIRRSPLKNEPTSAPEPRAIWKSKGISTPLTTTVACQRPSSERARVSSAARGAAHARSIVQARAQRV
jgi:hypothetical protein